MDAPKDNNHAESRRQPLNEDEKIPARLTDVGNGIRLVRRYGRDLRYCWPWKTWLVWNGQRWSSDPADIERKAKDTVLALYAEAAEIEDDAVRSALVSHAKKSESRRSLAAMIDLARSEPGMPVKPEEFDRDAFLLNVENGTIDLRTGAIRPHQREDMLTKIAPIVYDADAKCPIWESVLETIFGGNKETIAFVRRLFGYCLTADVSEHVLAIFHGSGDNGKSTIVETIIAMLGDTYAMKANSDLLLLKKSDSHPTALTDLWGKRLAAAIETDDGRRLAEGLVKELTGGDRIRARRMHQDHWEFSPSHKIVLATNHRPIIKGTDWAIWRRIRLVPFDVKIPEASKDRNLKEKLGRERSGIFNWCLAGCLEWQRDGLGAVSAVQDATERYRADQDLLGRFIADCCVLSPTAWTPIADMHSTQNRYADENGDPKLTKRELTKALEERGIATGKKRGERCYLAIGLIDFSAAEPQ